MRTLIILSILAMITVTSCNQQSTGNNDQLQTRTISSRDTEGLRGLSREVKPDDGEFIDPGKAHDKLQNHKDYWQALEIDDAYGFTFGVKKVERLLEMIAEGNDTIPDGKPKITGIRVYLSEGVTEINSRDQVHMDVFLIPTYSNGSNIFPVDDDFKESPVFFNDPPLLNASKPCPDLCD